MLAITEEDTEILNSWKEEASKQTIETLPVFMDKLLNQYQHDYGTICHAIAACAVAAAYAANASPQGGITGFQASGVMWEFIKGWDSSKQNVPLRLLDFSAMLYPQSEERFISISRESFEWLKEKAKFNLEKVSEGNTAHPDVIAHWESIVNDKVPFGYKISE